jgi:hypothetical protein
MSISHAQATASGTANGASTSVSAVLTNNPALGDLVIVSFFWFNGANGNPASLTVADSASNSYTKSTNSPAQAGGSAAGHAYVFYLLSAPSNATKTITATYTDPGSGGATEILADDFTVTAGTVSFDQDIAGSGGTGTTINTPTVAISSSGLEFCYGVPSGSVSSVNTPFTQGGIGADGSATGYILSTSISNTVSMSCSSSTWNSMGASCLFTPAVASNKLMWVKG